MGESKKIDVTGLAALCRKWLPAFRAADRLIKIGVVEILNSPDFVSFADIQDASRYTVSGTHRIISLAVDAGLVEKNPQGGRGGLYRATGRLWAVLASKAYTEALHVFSKQEDIFYTLNIDPHNQSALCEYIGARQTTISLQMKELIESGWIDGTREGKEVWYSLSDHARLAMALIENELRGLG
jgi:DNA-binding MarR family transcriptional regulator